MVALVGDYFVFVFVVQMEAGLVPVHVVVKVEAGKVLVSVVVLDWENFAPLGGIVQMLD